MSRRGAPQPPAHQARRSGLGVRGPRGGQLALRGALNPGARREYTETLAGGIDREDARQRAIELLFERLAVSWEIAGVTTDGP